MPFHRGPEHDSINDFFAKLIKRAARARGYMAVLEICGFSDWLIEKLQKTGCKEIRVLRGYLTFHRDRLRYCERLASGRSIGSGQVEGACKNLIGRRLKQTGARWRVRRANRMATLCAVLYGDQWKRYWKTAK